MSKSSEDGKVVKDVVAGTTLAAVGGAAGGLAGAGIGSAAVALSGVATLSAFGPIIIAAAWAAPALPFVGAVYGATRLAGWYFSRGEKT
jgi:hypothetical protein